MLRVGGGVAKRPDIVPEMGAVREKGGGVGRGGCTHITRYGVWEEGSGWVEAA